jgi:hypothetical protein
MVSHASSATKEAASVGRLSASGLLSAVALAMRRCGESTASKDGTAVTAATVCVETMQRDGAALFRALATRVGGGDVQSVTAMLDSGVVDACLHVVGRGLAVDVQLIACDVLCTLTAVSQRARREVSQSRGGVAALTNLLRSPSSTPEASVCAMWTLLNSALILPADASNANELVVGRAESDGLLRSGFASAMRSSSAAVKAAVLQLRHCQRSSVCLQAVWALRVTFDGVDSEGRVLHAGVADVADALADAGGVNALSATLRVAAATAQALSASAMYAGGGGGGSAAGDGSSSVGSATLAREAMRALRAVVVTCVTPDSRLGVRVASEYRQHRLRSVVERAMVVLARDAELVAAGASIVRWMDREHAGVEQCEHTDVDRDGGAVAVSIVTAPPSVITIRTPQSADSAPHLKRHFCCGSVAGSPLAADPSADDVGG